MDSHHLLDVINIHSCPFCTYDYNQGEEVAIFYPCNHNACNSPCYRDYVEERVLKRRSFPPCPCCNSDITDVKFVKFIEFTDLTVPNTPDIRSNLPIPEAMLPTPEDVTSTIVTDPNPDNTTDDDTTTPSTIAAFINTVVKKEETASGDDTTFNTTTQDSDTDDHTTTPINTNPTKARLEEEAIDYAQTLSLVYTTTPTTGTLGVARMPRPTPTNLDEAFALEQPVQSPAFYLMETPPATNPNHTHHPGNPTNRNEGLFTTYFQGQNGRRPGPTTPYNKMTQKEAHHHTRIRTSLNNQDRLMSWLDGYIEQDDDDEEIIQDLRKAVMNQGNQERCKHLSRLYAAGMWKTPEP
jgi:hypothetical protein